jgi:uncharacterized membrane protein YraQ (UPF0718 family)
MEQNKEITMVFLSARKILSVTAGAAALLCMIVPARLSAQSTNAGENIKYTASGTFGATPVSGNDTLKLSGENFSITVLGNSAKTPVQTGKNWAIFGGMKMSGTVYSGLLPGQAISISSKKASIQQTLSPSQDIFQCTFPVTVVGIALNVTAKVYLPGGTLKKATGLRPFASISLDDPSDTVVYSNPTAATTLSIASGTIAGTGSSGSDEDAAIVAPSAFLVLANGIAPKPHLAPVIWQ